MNVNVMLRGCCSCYLHLVSPRSEIFQCVPAIRGASVSIVAKQFQFTVQHYIWPGKRMIFRLSVKLTLGYRKQVQCTACDDIGSSCLCSDQDHMGLCTSPSERWGYKPVPEIARLFCFGSINHVTRRTDHVWGAALSDMPVWTWRITHRPDRLQARK